MIMWWTIPIIVAVTFINLLLFFHINDIPQFTSWADDTRRGTLRKIITE